MSFAKIRQSAKKNKKSSSKTRRNNHNSFVQDIYNKLYSSKSKCVKGGCKGFAANFFIEYLKMKRDIIPPIKPYINSLAKIDIGMYQKINSNNKLQLVNLRLSVAFIKNMSKVIYDDITRNTVVHCSIHKKTKSNIIPIHTFILFNGNIIYNSWDSNSSIDCNDLDLYKSSYQDKDDKTECYRTDVRMPITKIETDDTYNKLKSLISGTSTMNELTGLFGLQDEHFIGLGPTEDSTLHFQIIEEDKQKLFQDLNGSDILMLYLK